MHRFRLLIVVALTAVAVLCTNGLVPPTAWAQEPVLAVHNGRLLDGTGAPPIDDGVVLIEGNRITQVGSAGAVEIPPFATLIDAEGGLIMPGVIDSHVHVAVAEFVSQQNDIFSPWLRSGVTTLVDNGMSLELTASVRGLLEEVAEAAPRLFIAGPVLTTPGGYPEPIYPGNAQNVVGPDEAQLAVVYLVDVQGVDLIKVSIEPGFEADLDDPMWPVLSLEELAAIVEAAHERGLSVRAHVSDPQAFDAAITAGFDVAAHTPAVPLTDELLQRAADADMILVSTARIWVFRSEDAPLAVAENVARYAGLGGRVALGTDFPGPGTAGEIAGEMPVAEMQVLVEGGLTPAQVLVAATKHGAEAINQGAELGTLEPGKLADIIVVDGDPLSDISAMANVTVVIRGGEVIHAERRVPR
jgi:imidazolonepropionase-like amidohydrolase